MIPDNTPPNTLVDYPRLNKLIQFLKDTDHLPGIVAEVGVYKGGTALLIRNNTRKYLQLFDTFEGMPEVREGVDLHHKGDFADTSEEHVRLLLGPPTPASQYSTYKGVFPKVNKDAVEYQKYSFVHLDVDIYDSVYECLDVFGYRMNKGGIIALDDYLEPNCPGAKLAADRWTKENGRLVEPTVQSQAIIRF